MADGPATEPGGGRHPSVAVSTAMPAPSLRAASPRRNHAHVGVPWHERLICYPECLLRDIPARRSTDMHFCVKESHEQVMRSPTDFGGEDPSGSKTDDWSRA
jgi:hypothetical protein